MKYVYIHLGLHKTASTFLQRVFFPMHSNKSGYVPIRNDLYEFLDYTLNCNDLEFDASKAKSILNDCLNNIKLTSDKFTISDEQFCGSPWNDAKDRKRYFDRLNEIFTNAKYIIVLRNQEDMVESLYLQYVKYGGSANWRKFIKHKNHPLEFAKQSYLNYGDYINYIISKIGRKRLLCLYYEDMQRNPHEFLMSIASFIGFEINNDFNEFIQRKMNKSIPTYTLKLVLIINKIFSSIRQPFNALPYEIRKYIIYFILRLPQKRNNIFNDKELKDFVKNPKKRIMYFLSSQKGI